MHPRSHRAPCGFRNGVLAAIVLGLTLASGCGRTPGAGESAPVVPDDAVLIDVGKADAVLGCAAEQFAAHGYIVQPGPNGTRSVRAQRETSAAREAGRDAYEVNVTRAGLASVEGNPNLLRLRVESETRQFSSRDMNVGYSLRPTPRSDVVELSRGVLATCAKW